jgi:thiopurine S-methyltransferase
MESLTMDRTFWLERWHRREIGFHHDKVQPALETYWPGLNVPKGATVFVPLAGKSLDMVWLRDQGYRVVGVELSEVAVQEFFAERGVTPSVRKDGPFTVSFADQIELWCGDFFALNATALPPLDAAYDRAALVAMPDDMQPRYAAKMTELMPAGAPILLVGLDYNQSEMKGPPFAIPEAEIRKLFEDHFAVEVLGVRDGLAKNDHLAKRGVTRLEEATYLLKRRA